MTPTVRILGIRGIPASHGGFETFAESLALDLVSRGWRVIVYCQDDGSDPLHVDTWNGVERVHIPVSVRGTAGTMVFDWLTITHVLGERRAGGRAELCLTLGYNTAVFNARLRVAGVPNIINMDGIEWRRDKWGLLAKAWFRINEVAGCWLGDQLVADHPEIKRHLARHVDDKKLTVIPYGAVAVEHCDDEATHRALAELGLASGLYATLIARPEPENSILEIVAAWSAAPRAFTLAVLGRYDEQIQYHRRVRAAAGSEVRFLGPIFDKPLLSQLRSHARLYLHGHRVGGTNPSLVEAMAAGNPVIAHDNPFNRWVAGDDALYFSDQESLESILNLILNDERALAKMATASRTRHAESFTQAAVAQAYADLLEASQPRPTGAASGQQA